MQMAIRTLVTAVLLLGVVCSMAPAQAGPIQYTPVDPPSVLEWNGVCDTRDVLCHVCQLLTTAKEDADPDVVLHPLTITAPVPGVGHAVICVNV